MICETTDITQIVLPDVRGKIFSVDGPDNTFVAIFEDTSVILVKLSKKCTSLVFEMNKIVRDDFKASELKDSIEICSNVSITQNLTCGSNAVYNVTYSKNVAIPYFTGVNIFFKDEFYMCTKQFNEFIENRHFQVGYEDVTYFLLNKTKCWGVVSGTNQHTILFSKNETSKQIKYGLIKGILQKGMKQKFSNDIFLTSEHQSCINIFLQYVYSQGYHRNKYDIYLSVHNVIEYTSNFPCLEVHYQCIGDQYFMVLQLVFSAPIAYSEIGVTIEVTIVNIIILFIFLRKENRTPVTILLSALAISDTMHALLISFSEVIARRTEVHSPTPRISTFSYPLCLNILRTLLLSYIFHLFSVCITTLLCLQKTVALLFPIWSRVHLNTKVSFIGSVVVLVISVLLVLPLIIFEELNIKMIEGKCCNDRIEYFGIHDEPHRYTVLIINILNFLSDLVVLLCTVYIACKLTYLRRNLMWKDNPATQIRNRKSAITVVIICVIFLMSEALNISEMMIYFLSTSGANERPNNLRIELYQYKYLSIMIGFSMNFIVYLVMSKEMRGKVFRIMKCW